MEVGANDREGGHHGVVSVLLKNPTRMQQEGFKVEVNKAATLKELKNEISMSYPGRPEPSDITLVYAGKLLRDDSMDIESIVGSGREFGTVTMHMVVRETRNQQQDASVGAVERQIMDQRRIKAESTSEVNNGGAFCPGERSSVEVDMEAEDVGNSDARHSGPNGESCSECTHVVEKSMAKDSCASHLMPDDSSLRTQDYMYVPVFHAAYQAAVQALVSSDQVNKTGESTTGRQSINHKGTNSNEKNASTLAFLPTVIPLPQPAFPSAIPNQPWQGCTEGKDRSRSHKEQGTQQQEKPLLVPVMPLPISPCPKQHDSSNIWKNGPRRRRNDGQEQAETTEHVLRLLRELRGQQEQSDRIETENMNVQPNDQGGNNARRRQVQIRIHINMRVLLQVAVLLLIVYQHCPPGRFLALFLVGFIFYLSSTRIGKMILHRVLEHFHAHRMENRRRVAGQANNIIDRHDGGHARLGPNAPAPREQGGQNIARPPPGAGLIQELQAFIAGFITSLLPAAADNGALQGNNNMDMQGMQRDIFGANNGNA